MPIEMDLATIKQKLNDRFKEDALADRFGNCIHLTANLRNYLFIRQIPRDRIHVCAIFDP